MGGGSWEADGWTEEDFDANSLIYQGCILRSVNGEPKACTGNKFQDLIVDGCHVCMLDGHIEDDRTASDVPHVDSFGWDRQFLGQIHFNSTDE